MNAIETLTAKAPSFPKLVRMAGGAMAGFGLMLWIAANWDTITRMQKFGLVGGALLLFAALAAIAPAWRAGAALGAFLSIGALFALFGQTYQTGADPWQLFALWAAVGLPIAMGARHDLVLTPWAVVAFAGLALYGHQLSGFADSMGLMAAVRVWGIGLALVAALYLYQSRGQDRAGGGWALQVAGILFGIIVCAGALDALFSRTEMSGEYWLGLLILAGMIGAAALMKPRAFVQMAAQALMIDIALIAGVVRLFDIKLAERADQFLQIAILAAFIVAITGWLLMRMAPARHESARGLTTGEPEAPAPDDGKVTWPVAIVSGFGALLAAVPFLAFLAISFGDLFSSAKGMLAIGVPMTAAAILGLRRARPLGFLQQFACIGLVCGMGLMAAAFFVLLDRTQWNRDEMVFIPIALLTVVVALLQPVGWINVLLGWFGAGSAILALLFQISRMKGAPMAIETAMGANLFAILMVAVALWWRPARAGNGGIRAAALERYATGAFAMALFALMASAGMTFLSEAFVPLGRSRSIPVLQDGWHWMQAFSALLALAGTSMLLKHFDALRNPSALALAAAAVAFAAFSPNLGACTLLGAVLLQAGRRGLTGFAAFAGLWIAGTFYYWLGWPLMHKAALLAALGLGLMATSLVFSDEEGADRPAGPAEGPSGLLAPAAIALGAIVATGIALAGIRDNENVIATGQKIYLKIMPVDPRSLAQGDYMALRFDGGRLRDPDRSGEGEMFAIATLDARGIATPKSHAATRPAAGPGEIVFPLRRKNGAWIVASDAWYFKEGDGPRFAGARYGEFRLRSDGRMLLVGLADEQLRALN